MRDSHRLKEKFELSLDSRQIVSITVVSLVVLGGVFMLGVVTGKKLSADAAAATEKQPADLLSQLDKKTDALETVKADAALTFQDELTRKTPSAVPDIAPKPVETPKPVEVARPAEPVKPVEAAKPVEAPKPVEVAEVKPVEAPRPEAEKLPETPRPDPVATRTVDAGGASLKEAFGKVQKSPPETAADGSWTMQLSAYQDRGEADRFAAGLRDKGYAPYIIEANIPGKGTWYRVRMGRFANKDAATRYMDDFRRETAMTAIITQAN
ncbi:MAG: SPOR domain-containing protein [Myxococcaceae bacterium]